MNVRSMGERCPPSARTTRQIARVALTVLMTISTTVAHTGAVAADCGQPVQLKGKQGPLAARQFSDGSIAVRAPLAVNPDGGAASYTVGNHGFTYIANGLALWRDGRRQTCDSDCMRAFRDAEAAGFAAGTAEFCVFAMEVEPLSAGQATTPCSSGTVIGNGKGRPRLGPELATIGGGSIRPYVSTTSLRHRVGGEPAALDAESLPIVVTPRRDLLGHVVWVGGPGRRATFAVVGDVGPAFGEGSIALHQLLRTGSVTPQAPGPIPLAQRCGPGELALQPPFQSRPDLSDDRCRPGRQPRGAADVRAYVGIEDALDFVVLGTATLTRGSSVIPTEVKIDGLADAAKAAGYTPDRIQQMLACLGP